MMPAPRTIFLTFEFVRRIFFVLGCAVVTPFAFAALHLNDILHKPHPIFRFQILDFRLSAFNLKSQICNLRKPMTGIEPVTPSLPRKCSTTELHGQRNVSEDQEFKGFKKSSFEPLEHVEPFDPFLWLALLWSG
jgi:hypothetical protein